MKIDEQWGCWTLCAIRIEGTYRGEGTTPVAKACPEDRAEVKTSYELSWKVKVIIKKTHPLHGISCVGRINQIVSNTQFHLWYFSYLLPLSDCDVHFLVSFLVSSRTLDRMYFEVLIFLVDSKTVNKNCTLLAYKVPLRTRVDARLMNFNYCLYLWIVWKERRIGELK